VVTSVVEVLVSSVLDVVSSEIEVISSLVEMLVSSEVKVISSVVEMLVSSEFELVSSIVLDGTESVTASTTEFSSTIGALALEETLTDTLARPESESSHTEYSPSP
jgi:hypothetical protein